MDNNAIIELVRKMNITEYEEDFAFKAAVIIFTGIENNTCGYSQIKKLTGYYWKEVAFIMWNLKANKIIHEYRWNMEMSDNGEENFMEVILCSMCGAGEIVRCIEGDHVEGNKSIKWDEFQERAEFCCGYIAIENSMDLPIEEIRERNNLRRNGLPAPIIVESEVEERDDIVFDNLMLIEKERNSKPYEFLK